MAVSHVLLELLRVDAGSAFREGDTDDFIVHLLVAFLPKNVSA
jgi:hypothetical protein